MTDVTPASTPAPKDSDSWASLIAQPEKLSRGQRLAQIENAVNAHLTSTIPWRDHMEERMRAQENWTNRMIGAIGLGSFAMGIIVAILLALVKMMWDKH